MQTNESPIGLGIDAGGTFTDAVIFDLAAKRVLAKAKSLTTYHDLVEGIRGVLVQLPVELLGRVGITSLSTTLATNAIVEGKGHKVGVIALSPWDWTEKQIGHRPVINVPGHVAITGEVTLPLDERMCRSAIGSLVEDEGCASIVVAGYALTRNPEQAIRVRQIAGETFDLPVVCAHEVSRRLNGIQAAQTAIANARLIPIIRDLIGSVRKALECFSISGRLMVVKGDGTPVDEKVARLRPVETILSGPAASVSGARVLTGLNDALVIDIGGTTTDTAIMESGRVAVAPEGARIGTWVMGIDAVEISTVGLGGDSRIDFDRERRITIGPSRSIPISYLAYEHQSVERFLSHFNTNRHIGDPDASALDVLVAGRECGQDISDRERALLDILKEGPVPSIVAAKRLGLESHLLLPVGRLERCGAVNRASLTPTDLLHVDGRFTRWNVGAARRALEIFAAILRMSADDVSELVLGLVTRKLFQEIVHRELSFDDKNLRDLPKSWTPLLDRAFSRNGGGLRIDVKLLRPIIAIGGPAGALMPNVGKHIGAEIVVPEDSDVANAVGAIASEVVVYEEVIIRPGGPASNYVVHTTEERLELRNLDRATEYASETATKLAIERAISAGAVSPSADLLIQDSLGTAANGRKIFLERKVTATASGCTF